MQILLVEDDRRISEYLVKGLEEQGYSVTLCETGSEARDMLFMNDWHVVVMDIMLPDIDGIQLTKMLRYRKNITPVIILSALSETEDKISALDSGADDYLVKPFHFKELLSRINALSRRSKYIHQESNDNTFSAGDIEVNLDKFETFVGDREIKLSPREFKLLSYLLENKNKVLSRTKILDAVWGIDYDSHTNIVDVYISYLRSKIGAPDNERIMTTKGVGYMIKD
ncbi:MAG TPA: response regulator transcription factor [Sphingobacterium sp.]|nr:response regulator transcription factor [Sphingobacterium sp.]